MSIVIFVASFVTAFFATEWLRRVVSRELKVRRAIRRAKMFSKGSDVVSTVYYDYWMQKAMKNYLDGSVKSLYRYDGKPTGIKFSPHNKHDRHNG